MAWRAGSRVRCSMAKERCVVVEDVVSTGGSTLAAIAALQEAGLSICGVISVLDRLNGAGEAIETAARAPMWRSPRSTTSTRSGRTPEARCPRQESNLDLPLRRRPSCPLDYEGSSSSSS